MASSSSNPLQGMSDIAAPDVFLWQQIESSARNCLQRYGFEEVRTPILERLDLYLHSLGDTTDIVQKEMYQFTDRGGRELALRPEGTAGVMRFAAGLSQEIRNARLYYFGPMYRAERPQAGRKRQFHQVGVEALGAPCPAADAEVMALQLDVLRSCGIDGCQIQLNTRGTAEDQVAVQKGIRAALDPHRSSLSEDSLSRLDKNVLRVLDAKDEATRAIVKELPPVTDFMCKESIDYLDQVKAHLDALGVSWTHNPLLVRGLDYYAHSIWEITHDALGAQDALAGGGRYRFEGKSAQEGVGFAIGLERMVMVLTALGQAEVPPPVPDVTLISLGDEALRANFIRLQALRAAGIHAEMDLRGRKMKVQMQEANRRNSRFVAIVGEDELAQGVVNLKDMASGDQELIPEKELPSRLH